MVCLKGWGGSVLHPFIPDTTSELSDYTQVRSVLISGSYIYTTFMDLFRNCINKNNPFTAVYIIHNQMVFQNEWRKQMRVVRWIWWGGKVEQTISIPQSIGNSIRQHLIKTWQKVWEFKDVTDSQMDLSWEKHAQLPERFMNVQHA